MGQGSDYSSSQAAAAHTSNRGSRGGSCCSCIRLSGSSTSSSTSTIKRGSAGLLCPGPSGYEGPGSGEFLQLWVRQAGWSCCRSCACGQQQPTVPNVFSLQQGSITKLHFRVLTCAKPTFVALWPLQVLSSSSLDSAVVLADGSNLLHVIVDRQDVLVSAEHMSVLLHVLRQRMRPEEFMGDLEAHQQPRDLGFMEHKTPDGLTVLYKVGRHAAGCQFAMNLNQCLHAAVPILPCVCCCGGSA